MGSHKWSQWAAEFLSDRGEHALTKLAIARVNWGLDMLINFNILFTKMHRKGFVLRNTCVRVERASVSCVTLSDWLCVTSNSQHWLIWICYNYKVKWSDNVDEVAENGNTKVKYLKLYFKGNCTNFKHASVSAGLGEYYCLYGISGNKPSLVREEAACNRLSGYVALGLM